MTLAYIGLGSNLQQPRNQVERALAELAQLPDCDLRGCSALYRSQAVGPGAQPDYINAVASLETVNSPLALLDQLQALEQLHGRQRLERWGPRTLDLDLLLYGDEQIDVPRLQVPHPQMLVRSFVLLPLHDLCRDLILPNGTAIQSQLQGLDCSGVQRLDQEPDFLAGGNHA
jgi:2-amino-4-hydroxy-6-hydroxymethyldihydropteridine diphosphokinase